jgi:hypothetical protein
MTSRKKPGVAFWATVVVVAVLVAYPLSMGPIAYLASHQLLPEWSRPPLQAIYSPMPFVIKVCGGTPILDKYLDLWRS